MKLDHMTGYCPDKYESVKKAFFKHFSERLKKSTVGDEDYSMLLGLLYSLLNEYHKPNKALKYILKNLIKREMKKS